MRVSLAAAFVMVWLLGACGSAPPPLAFEQSTRASVKRIYLPPPGIPEHAQVSIMNPIGAGFGVLGSLIETHREATADGEMEEVLGKARYDFGSALDNAITLAVRKAGFTVSRGEAPRAPRERGKFLAQYPKRLPVDGYLDVYVPFVGFQATQSSAAYRPRIEIVARLVDARGTTLFQRRIVYGLSNVEDEDAIVVTPDENATFRDRAALQANPSGTARALQGAIDAVAWELAGQLR